MCESVKLETPDILLHSIATFHNRFQIREALVLARALPHFPGAVPLPNLGRLPREAGIRLQLFLGTVRT